MRGSFSAGKSEPELRPVQRRDCESLPHRRAGAADREQQGRTILQPAVPARDVEHRRERGGGWVDAPAALRG